MLFKKGIKSVLIMGTPCTMKHGLYRFEGIRSFEPNIREMKLLTDAILKFNIGVEKKQQAERVKEICLKYLNRGAETIILGCTEFAVMLGEENFPKINTIDVLVDATVNTLDNHSPFIYSKKPK